MKKGTKNREDKQKTNSKMTDFNLVVSIITLNVNDLNNPIKGQRLSDWIKEKKLYLLSIRNDL